MTGDEQAFFRAAAADPFDDTPRLVYADWLDEQDGPTFVAQAEFVRLQVRRSRLDASDPARASLLAAEAVLLQKSRRHWNGRVHRHLHQLGVPGWAIRGWDYHRGMIARVTVTTERLLAHQDEVLSLGPIQFIKAFGPSELMWGPTWRNPISRALAVARAGRSALFPGLTETGVLGQIPLLDLRSFGASFNPDRLPGLAREGSIPPVVLFSWRVRADHLTRAIRGREHTTAEATREEPHVIDPFGKWDGLRPWYADLTGETLSPIPYHGTSR